MNGSTDSKARQIFSIIRFYLINTALEISVGLLRLLIFLLALPLTILLRLGEWLLGLLKRETFYPEEIAEPCPPLPESIIRRPDPCIYSQISLHAAGLPFTMNNPDIWYFDPTDPTVRNPPLEPDKDYVVNVRVHNASTDAAIGVRVGTTFTGPAFTFTGPDLIPLEQDPLGEEIFKFVDIAPLDSTVTSFDWHTPQQGPGTIFPSALRVKLFHPADTNPDNNLGIHNILTASPNPGHFSRGEQLDIELPIYNPFPRQARFRIESDTYTIDNEDKVTLQLVKTRGHAERSLSAHMANLQPRLVPGQNGADNPDRRQNVTGKFSWNVQPRLQLIKARYDGFGSLQERILNRNYSLPTGLTVTPVDGDDERGWTLKPEERRSVKVRLGVSDDAEIRPDIPVNIATVTSTGALVGGLTIMPPIIGGA